ncbi:MAG: siderophore-interacting protein [Pseudomonadota bacterium]
MLEQLRKILANGRFGPAEVTQVESLTPHVIRVRIASDVIRDFSATCPGGHLKLVVPGKDETAEDFQAIVEAANFRPVMRTYTIRNIYPDTAEIDVDIAVHGELGRVGPWAQRAQVGDVLVISKCGSPKLVTDGAKRVLAAADLTSFPALAAGLETLADDVIGEVFVEIPSTDDTQPVRAPKGVDITWLIKSDPHEPSTELLDAIKDAEMPDAQTSVFAAGEFSMVAELRSLFQSVDKRMKYISSYWKVGADENGHKLAKSIAA